MKSCCNESCDCNPAERKPRSKTWLIAVCGAAAFVLILQAMLG